MNNFMLLYKWVYDGGSSQAQYQIKFHHSISSTITHSDLKLFSFLPIQQKCTLENIKVIISKPTVFDSIY